MGFVKVENFLTRLNMSCSDGPVHWIHTALMTYLDPYSINVCSQSISEFCVIVLFC